MHRTALAATLLLAAAAVLAADAPPQVTYFAHAAVAKGGTLLAQPNLSVSMLNRKGPGMVEIHDQETDTFYVLGGSATIVTGGRMLGGNVTAPGQQRGTDIVGGEARTLSTGDVMVIPAGIPHWFKEVPSSIDYYVVKVIAP
jgi:quercetin dioxygenase-like cupin family protein